MEPRTPLKFLNFFEIGLEHAKGHNLILANGGNRFHWEALPFILKRYLKKPLEFNDDFCFLLKQNLRSRLINPRGIANLQWLVNCQG